MKPTRYRREIAGLLNRRREQMRASLDDYRPAAVDGTRDGDVVELLIYDVIGDFYFGGVSAIEVASFLREHSDATRVDVRINSPGGDFFDGVAIFNALARHQAEIVVHVDGLAASAASLIAMAGDRVVMGEATQLMLHRAWTLAIGNEGELDAVAKLLRQLDTEAAKVYSRRSGLTVDHIADMLRGEGEGDGTWLSADEAIELGLADETTADVPTLDDDSLDVSQLDTLRIAAFLPGGNTMPKTKLSKRPADDTHLDSEDEQLEQEQDDEADNGADTESTAGDADTADDAGADDAGDEAADSDGGEPANFEQLQQLAGDDAQFIVAQQAAKASLPTATKAYIAHLKAQRDAAAEERDAKAKQLRDAQAAAGDVGEESAVSGGQGDKTSKGRFADCLRMASNN